MESDSDKLVSLGSVSYQPLLVFYVNHLGWELLKSNEVFSPAS